MSLPLKDCRTGIPEWVDIWLDIEAASTGKDKSAITREIITAWGKAKLHAHKVATKRLQANGMQPELFADDMEDAGTSRNQTGKGGR